MSNEQENQEALLKTLLGKLPDDKKKVILEVSDYKSRLIIAQAFVAMLYPGGLTEEFAQDLPLVVKKMADHYNVELIGKYVKVTFFKNGSLPKTELVGLPENTSIVLNSNTNNNTAPSSTRYWAFCDAVNSDGTNLIRYQSSTACWRAEIGPLEEGYTGRTDAVDSFRQAGWGIAWGDAKAKHKGMRVIRP